MFGSDFYHCYLKTVGALFIITIVVIWLGTWLANLGRSFSSNSSEVGYLLFLKVIVEHGSVQLPCKIFSAPYFAITFNSSKLPDSCSLARETRGVRFCPK